MNKYAIPFKGLKNGEHTFEFAINDDFFADIEDAIISSGKVDVYVDMTKKETLIELYFDIVGTVSVQCDRCLDSFDIDIETEQELFVKFGDQTTDITDVDDVMTIGHGDHEIDLKQHIYEYIALSVPYQNVHPDDEDGNSTCDPEMLVRIDEMSVGQDEDDDDEDYEDDDSDYEDDSDEAESNNHNAVTDPRWDALKKL